MVLIKTQRLILRDFEMNDVSSFHALESNPAVVRYQTWGPKTFEESGITVQKTIEGSKVRPRKLIELAVELNTAEAAKFLGRVGCFINDRTASMWFSFLPEVHGNGYATEAVTGLRMFLREKSEDVAPVDVLQIECDPRNAGSWKLAERLRFVKVKEEKSVFECKGEWVDSVVYEQPL